LENSMLTILDVHGGPVMVAAWAKVVDRRIAAC
jgi:hypothetical protein